MDRVAGIETEYGCLVSGESATPAEVWPARVKNHIFKKAGAGLLDLHYRDYEEPPGNGGFLLNGGRLYLDMGHLEYASPECRSVFDVVTFDLAGDQLIQSAVDEMGAAGEVAFIKNNVDHETGATFGCHENFSMKRELQFNQRLSASLLSFLATRQLFTGAGRVGQATPTAFEFTVPQATSPVPFQISQRADHIVNDIYQWVQFNRAIINARDEPLADYRKFRRLHLLIGDSNMSPFANALKIGTTALLLTLLEEGSVPSDVILQDAVQATREISHEGSGRAVVTLEDGRSRSALDIQQEFLEHASKILRGRDDETDWVLDQWGRTLGAVVSNPHSLIGAVDWISKKWLLESFRESEGLEWDDPWLQSIDLEYHDINPAKGLFFALTPPRDIDDFNARMRRPSAMKTPPSDTRARGRGLAVSLLQARPHPYMINWDSIARDDGKQFAMPDPFETYEAEISRFAG